MLLNERFSPFFSHHSPHSFPVHSIHPSSPTISSCLYLSCLSSIYLHPFAFMFAVHFQTPFLSACLHFLHSMPSTLFSLTTCFLCCPPFSPPFCHPPFQPTYSTFALDTHLYFSFIFALHLTISSFIFHPSFQLVPLQLYSSCYSLCQVHFRKYSACLVLFQPAGYHKSKREAQRMSSIYPQVPTRQVFFHVAVG